MDRGEPSPDQTPGFRVRGGQALLVYAVKLLIEQSSPGADIDMDVVPTGDGSPVRVELTGGERWMALLPTMAPTDAMLGALRDGAWCLVSTDSTPREFAAALQGLIRGTDPGIPVAVARRLFAARPAVAHERIEEAQLTPREREVLTLVAEGQTNAEIARRLSISIHTVRTHLSSMMTKLEARSRVELVRAAVNAGYDEARFPERPAE